MSTCTNCGQDLREGARFCDECGALVAVESSSHAEEWIEPDPRVCPACGEPLGSAIKGECSRCGTYVVVNTRTGRPVVVPRPQQRRSIFWPVVAALLFVFVVLPILFFVGCAACGGAFPQGS